MNKHHITTILPTLEEVYHASQSEYMYCATFTTSSGPAPTIQLIPHTLNICEWQFEQNPECEIKQLLGDLLPNLRLDHWMPETHAVFEFDAVSITKQAEAIDLLFLRYLHSPRHYHLQVEEIYPTG